METLRLKAPERRKINRVICNLPVYFESIPVTEIDSILREFGYLLIQEDYTAYEGIFCGEQGNALLQIGLLSSEYLHNGIPSYTPVENSCLSLSWYKMGAGRYEIVVYLS